MPSEASKLGILSATSYLIGDVIGSGIFISPAGILQYSGSVGLSLIIWTLSGLVNLLGAVCYADLGTSMPYSGGDFAYLCFYQWEPVAFAFVWCFLVIYKPCAIAILMQTFGQYIVQSVSPILDISPTNTVLAENLFGVVILLLMMWINFFQLTKYAAKIQVMICFFKISSLLIIIITGFVYIGEGKISNLKEPMSGTNWNLQDMILALSTGLWSYGGWDTLNFGIEEVKNPKRTLLVAAVFSMVIVIIIFVATNIAYFTVLGVGGMLNSTAVAESFSQVALGDFSYAIPALVGIVIIGSLNTTMFTTSRYFYAAARKGHLPSFMKLRHVVQITPQPSLVTVAILGIIMVNVAKVNTLIHYASFVIWLQRLFTISGFIWIRLRRWQLNENALNIPLCFHVLFLICLVLFFVMQTYAEWQVTIINVSVALMGLLIYYILIWPKRLPQIFNIFDEFVMKLCQIVFFAIPENTYCENLENTEREANEEQPETVIEKY